MNAIEQILIQLENIEKKTLQDQKVILLDISEKIRAMICDKSHSIEERKLANEIHIELQASIMDISKMIIQDEQWYNNEILKSGINLN